jgi:integrase
MAATSVKEVSSAAADTMPELVGAGYDTDVVRVPVCGKEYRLLVLFLAYTGLRWGEMAALRVGRVDFLRRRVLVSESVTPVKGVMTFGPTKGHERREVPLPRFLFGDRLDVVADAMDSARASALSGVYPPLGGAGRFASRPCRRTSSAGDRV